MLSTLLIACGATSSSGTLGSGGSAGSRGSGGAGGAIGVGGFAIPGSYDLVVGKVVATPQFTGGPTPPSSPSEGQTMRLDVRRSASGSISGVITPRWGTPAALDGHPPGSRFQFTGQVFVGGFDSNADTSDYWKVLEVGASGDALGTAVTMRGTEHLTPGDTSWSFDVSAEATLGEDVTPPELRSEPASPRGPSDALLPWDPIEVDCAEPVMATVFEPKVSVLVSDVDHAGDLTPVPITWSFSPTDEPASWAGFARAEGRLSGWDHHPTQIAKPYTLHAAAGIVDAAGLQSGEFSTSFAVLDVGAPRPSFTFDVVGAPPPVSWGLVAFHDGPSSEAVRCETGGCAEIGPFDTSYCGLARQGFAGRVEAPTGTLAVRYRLLFASDALRPDEPPPAYGSVFTIEIATAGRAPIVEGVVLPSLSSLLDLGSPAGELRWATPWTTALVALPGPVPPTVIDLGFAIGSTEAGSDSCGGPVSLPVKTLLVVDAVSGQ